MIISNLSLFVGTAAKRIRSNGSVTMGWQYQKGDEQINCFHHYRSIEDLERQLDFVRSKDQWFLELLCTRLKNVFLTEDGLTFDIIKSSAAGSTYKCVETGEIIEYYHYTGSTYIIRNNFDDHLQDYTIRQFYNYIEMS